MSCAVRACAVALAAAGLAFPALAADESMVLRQSAERLAAAGRCDEAMTKAKRARTLDPEDAEAAAIEGRCALHLERYDQAIDPLQRARDLDPSLEGLSADLAMAHYHRGDLAAASRELDAAEREDPEDPRVQLYRGLVLLDRSEDAAAAARFERAASLADAGVDPLASYYAGLAWQRARERQKAREDLERVVAGDPDGPWADAARRRLAELDAATGFEPGRWSASASTGVEYDDNVVLRGEGVSLPSDISDEDDWSVWWSADLRAELLRTENWAGGATGGYYGNAHFELEDFNQHTPTASLWLDRRVDDQSFLRLQPFFGYTWFGGDPYLMNVGGVLSYNRDFDAAGQGVLYTSLAYRNYLYAVHGPFADDLDRDGLDFRAGYEHAIAVTDTTTLRGGLEYGLYEAEGREYSHSSYGGSVGLRQGLPWKLTFDAEATYAWEPYRHASRFGPTAGASGPDRRDHYLHARAQLDRPITDWMSVAAYYAYTNNDSNTRPFDYDRNVVGGFVTVYYGPQ